MNIQDWGGLDPQTVSRWINFDGRNPDWHYDEKSRDSMAAKQTEGVAYLWNLLSTEGTALLADEVGMGKTFQALGVAALLWKMKPHARVLVMAPNRDICRHWRREFDTLVRVHYRDMDHSVKNSVDGGPVPAVQICSKLEALASAVERNSGHLYLTTIHSLSSLVPKDQKDRGNLANLAAGTARQLRQRIKRALGGEGFDLVIVDEAHYLRNIGGGSQRVAAARELFGVEGDRLGQHNLLLTATPSHTRLIDVHSFLKFFTDADTVDPDRVMTDGELTRALLEKYGLRRLRLMEGVGGLYGKRHYRHEKGAPSSFEGRPNAEMFYALYQKRLVTQLRKQRENRSLMYGYLEGFESMGRRPQAKAETSQNLDTDIEDPGIEDTGAEDFSKARDTDLLRELTADYYDRLKQFPEHPKYSELIEQCVPATLYDVEKSLSGNKHLVFVRRIPSVRELTQRLNAGYDELLATMIVQAWRLENDSAPVKRWRDQGWTRDGFDQLLDQIGGKGDQVDEVPDVDEADDDENSYLASRIAELFVVKKGGGGQTDCVNVRLRFVKPESIFSLFLEPAKDYLTAGYRQYYSVQGKSDYAGAALYERFSAWNSEVDLRAAVGPRTAPGALHDHEVSTVWSLIVPRIPERLKQKLADWSTSQKPVAENFANYLKAGLLYASPVIVELYCWFVQFRAGSMDRDAHRNYTQFLDWVDSRIDDSLLLRYFIAALETFDQMCGKIVDHGLGDWRQDWTSLKRLTSPAWYASGDNSEGRQRLILGFNSPFYPNVLVSTSVLQEGVNLHLSCHQIHHYGLAGSPGDNEQRVGRLDRLFGCINKRLKTGGDTDLSIFYPYLKRSVDEDQVASFVERKHRVEEQMDACIQSRFDKEVRISKAQDWADFLRRPLKLDEAPLSDPYPACFKNQADLPAYQPHATHADDEILDWLEAHFKRAIDPAREYFQRVTDGSRSPRTIFLIDPLLEQTGNKRHQPVFVNLCFSPEFSALVPETAYILSLASPIANKLDLETYCRRTDDAFAKLEGFISLFNNEYPLVRLAINESAGNSYFYLSATVDLPLFVRQGHLEMLSFYEIEMAFNDLKRFSDSLELALFEAEQDLTPNDLVDMKPAVNTPKTSEKWPAQNGVKFCDWQTRLGKHGAVACLTEAMDKSPADLIARLLPSEISVNGTCIDLLRLNHQYPMVRFERNGERTRLLLAYPQSDLQHQEHRLLESWFNYVMAVCG